MKLTANFTLEECTRSSTALRFGIDNTLPDSLKDNVIAASMGMERVRTCIGRPIHVESWYRSAAVNRAVGGSQTSNHMKGLAVDWWPVDGKSDLLQIAHKLANNKENIGFNTLIMEGTWLHIDFPPLGVDPAYKVLTAYFKAGEKTTYTEGLA
jgi:hypothetical protein